MPGLNPDLSLIRTDHTNDEILSKNQDSAQRANEVDSILLAVSAVAHASGSDNQTSSDFRHDELSGLNEEDSELLHLTADQFARAINIVFKGVTPPEDPEDDGSGKIPGLVPGGHLDDTDAHHSMVHTHAGSTFDPADPSSFDVTESTNFDDDQGGPISHYVIVDVDPDQHHAKLHAADHLPDGDDPLDLSQFEIGLPPKGIVTLDTTETSATVVLDEDDEIQDPATAVVLLTLRARSGASDPNTAVWVSDVTTTGFDVNIASGITGGVLVQWVVFDQCLTFKPPPPPEGCP